MAKSTCVVVDENGNVCGLPNQGRRMCNKHYKQWRKGRDANPRPLIEQRRSLEDRFWEKVNKDGPIPEHVPELGPCWQWTGKPSHGRAVFHNPDRRGTDFASRVAWFLANGDPGDQQVLHKCDNAMCVRTGKGSHLYLGDNDQNVRDRQERERQPRGITHGIAHLTEQDIRDIRAMYVPGVITQREIGRIYGIDQGHVSRIINRQLWPHIP